MYIFYTTLCSCTHTLLYLIYSKCYVATISRHHYLTSLHICCYMYRESLNILTVINQSNALTSKTNPVYVAYRCPPACSHSARVLIACDRSPPQGSADMLLILFARQSLEWKGKHMLTYIHYDNAMPCFSCETWRNAFWTQLAMTAMLCTHSTQHLGLLFSR